MSLREELKNKIWKEFNLFNEKHKHLPRKDFFIANATYLINRCAEYEERYTKERKAKEEVCKALDIMKNAFEKKSKLLQQERHAKEELEKQLVAFKNGYKVCHYPHDTMDTRLCPYLTKNCKECNKYYF